MLKAIATMELLLQRSAAAPIDLYIDLQLDYIDDMTSLGIVGLIQPHRPRAFQLAIVLGGTAPDVIKGIFQIYMP